MEIVLVLRQQQQFQVLANLKNVLKLLVHIKQMPNVKQFKVTVKQQELVVFLPHLLLHVQLILQQETMDLTVQIFMEKKENACTQGQPKNVKQKSAKMHQSQTQPIKLVIHIRQIV